MKILKELNKLTESVGDITKDEYNKMVKIYREEEDELPADLIEKLYEYVVISDPMWMPYGTQKGRDGDPDEWIYDNMDDILNAIERQYGY